MPSQFDSPDPTLNDSFIKSMGVVGSRMGEEVSQSFDETMSTFSEDLRDMSRSRLGVGGEIASALNNANVDVTVTGQFPKTIVNQMKTNATLRILADKETFKFHNSVIFRMNSMISNMETSQNNVQSFMENAAGRLRYIADHPGFVAMEVLAKSLRGLGGMVKGVLFGFSKRKSGTDRIVDAIDELIELQQTGTILNKRTILNRGVVGVGLGAAATLGGFGRRQAERAQELRAQGRGDELGLRARLGETMYYGSIDKQRYGNQFEQTRDRSIQDELRHSAGRREYLQKRNRRALKATANERAASRVFRKIDGEMEEQFVGEQEEITKNKPVPVVIQEAANDPIGEIVQQQMVANGYSEMSANVIANIGKNSEQTNRALGDIGKQQSKVVDISGDQKKLDKKIHGELEDVNDKLFLQTMMKAVFGIANTTLNIIKTTLGTISSTLLGVLGAVTVLKSLPGLFTRFFGKKIPAPAKIGGSVLSWLTSGIGRLTGGVGLMLYSPATGDGTLDAYYKRHPDQMPEGYKFHDYSGVSTKGTIKNKNDRMAYTFNAYKQLGFSDAGAKAMVAQIGRENDFRPDAMFGTHTDAKNGKTNAGFISWQGPRRKNLVGFMGERDLVNKDGTFVRGKKSISAMASFSVQEMKRNKPELLKKLRAGTLSQKQLSVMLGEDYIRWAAHDPERRASGIRRRDKYARKINGIVSDVPQFPDGHSNKEYIQRQIKAGMEPNTTTRPVDYDQTILSKVNPLDNTYSPEKAKVRVVSGTNVKPIKIDTDKIAKPMNDLTASVSELNITMKAINEKGVRANNDTAQTGRVLPGITVTPNDTLTEAELNNVSGR